MHTILIEIQGGKIVNTASTIPDVQFLVVDRDNQDAGEDPVTIIIEPEEIVTDNNFFRYLYERDNNADAEIHDELKRLGF